MKIFRAISGFLIFCCIVVLTSCATHSKPATIESGAAAEIPTQNLQSLVVSEALGKTIIDIPLESDTQIYADHDSDMQVKVLLSPPVSDFELPYNVTSLVGDITKNVDGGKVSSINVFLNEKSKFLLSRQSETMGRLMLVPDEVAPPQLPSNYITSLNFKPKNDSLQVVTYSSLPFEVTPGQEGDFKLTFRKVQFQDSLLKKYDVTKLGSSIDYVTAVNDKSGNAYLLFSGAKSPALTVLRKGDETHIMVKAKAATQTAAFDAAAASPEVPAEESAEIQELNTLFPGMKERYTGERISIDL